ncbi:hypothetical protein [Natronogracilivirga saccharolytica]|uniref:Uncharacterized protein n=1 Tax=Natronogracilivirga saccharolytica TaxID=2812953 RepID=A0A8J7RNG4_9BACT|nr:hypothetical protein [Natronogracilivirga saccharolytica]MBP3192964.1 hypothetical protein [Natronogracilivirga saccharolytica]
MKKKEKKYIQTIHTSRTIMFDELKALISHGAFEEEEIIALNVFNKQSGSGIRKTLNFLSKLYDFRDDNQLWRIFLFMWKMSNEADQRVLSLLYAVYKDDLLRASIPVVLNTPKGKKIQVEKLQDKLYDQFPDRYTPKTMLSAAQNVASSWKKAAYIEGKVRNIRIPIQPGYPVVLFALFLGERDGLVGKDLLSTTWIKVLDQPLSRIKELLASAALNDLIEYQEAGGIIIIRLQKLHNKITS